MSSEQGSPKSRAGGLVACHQSFICGELHHPSGLQGQRFGRFRIWLLPAASSGTDWGMHLEFGSGLRACCARSGVRSSSRLTVGAAGRGVSVVSGLSSSVDLDKRRGGDPRAGATSWTGSTSGPGNVLASRLQISYSSESTCVARTS